jgi:YidC/Oxa1 family membrane protein insertase
MMEKRALMAMMLILAVLLVYQMFFVGEKPPADQPAATAPTGTSAGDEGRQTAEPGQALSGEGAPVAGGSPGVPDAAGQALAQAAVAATEVPAREVVVRTPLYRVVFSSRGGAVTSFRLNRYPGVDNQPVELVPAAEDGPFGLALLTRRGDRVDLAAAPFEMSAESLTVAAGGQASLDMVFTSVDGLSVRKTCAFLGDTYTITVALEVGGPGSDEVRAVEFGWQSGLEATEANRADDLNNFTSLTLTGETLVKSGIGKVRKGEAISVGGPIAWSGLRSKYFLVGFVPPEGVPAVARVFPGATDGIGMKLETETAAGRPLTYLVYVGPLDYQDLKVLGHGLGKAVDFGWKWISPLSRLIFAFLVLCYRAIPNYGWVIIILSALTKLLFHPLTQKSMKSMRQMQKVQPEIAALREKHKKDPQALNKAIMELYRKRGVNPMGGCLPLVLQMPVFIALFNVLQKTIELRRADFIFWINDLSAPDVIAHMPFSLPFIGSAVSLLPILMGIAMFVQQKMTTTDPKQAMMTYVLPIVFTVMFYKFPSGLVLYWLVNNVLTIAHQYYMTRADRLADEQQAQA